jgi:hypothetical protein
VGNTDIDLLDSDEGIEGSMEKSLTTSDRPPKQKKRKLSKIERAESASNALITKVIIAQSEQQKIIEETERERMKWEEQ